MRQAEVESLQSHVESLQSGTSELQFQLRQATERIALLSDELSEARREEEYREHKSRNAAEESSRVRSLEARYETKINQLTTQVSLLEKERDAVESDLSRVIQQRTQEIDVLKRRIEDSALSSGETQNEVAGLKAEVAQLKQQISSYKSQFSLLEEQKDRTSELEVSRYYKITQNFTKIKKALIRENSEEFEARSAALERSVKEAKEREAHIRSLNKVRHKADISCVA